MSDLPKTDTLRHDEWSGDNVEGLATTALSVVATPGLHESEVLNGKFLDLFEGAALDRDKSLLDAVVSRMRTAGVTAEDIADFYIPAVARRLGDQWCEDEVGFASVTIACARLQGLLRELGPEWRADEVADGDAPGLLMIVGAGVYHTLGAMVLSGQMRRRGLSVRLLIGAELDAVGPTLRQARFDAVLISATKFERHEPLRKLVHAVKHSTPFPPPVVIGGSILEILPRDGAEVTSLTGADFATSDLNEALALCGIRTIPRTGVGIGHGV
ncbi:MAG: cobalamin B12-binding domain-containing protein [Rhodobacterales bacterium]|nr:cobalamin B12-binding domain-containing protein [Rhodobacterales bacterium]